MFVLFLLIVSARCWFNLTVTFFFWDCRLWQRWYPQQADALTLWPRYCKTLWLNAEIVRRCAALWVLQKERFSGWKKNCCTPKRRWSLWRFHFVLILLPCCMWAPIVSSQRLITSLTPLHKGFHIKMLVKDTISCIRIFLSFYPEPSAEAPLKRCPRDIWEPAAYLCDPITPFSPIRSLCSEQKKFILCCGLCTKVDPYLTSGVTVILLLVCAALVFIYSPAVVLFISINSNTTHSPVSYIFCF